MLGKVKQLESGIGTVGSVVAHHAESLDYASTAHSPVEHALTQIAAYYNDPGCSHSILAVCCSVMNSYFDRTRTLVYVDDKGRPSFDYASNSRQAEIYSDVLSN